MAVVKATPSTKASRVAVLLPAYNAEVYIEAALRSLLAQTCADFDVWVMDDGSGDSTARIAEAVNDSRIRLVRNSENMGLIATLNRGLDLIGEAGGYAYIARMDADDVALPERLAKQVAFLEAHPEIGLCSTGMRMTGTERARLVYPVSPLAVHYAPLGMVSRLSHPSVMMRAEIFADGNVRYDKDYPHAEDTRMWSVLARRYKMSNLNEVLYLYHIHGGNVSVLKAEAQKATAQRVQVDEFAYVLGREVQVREVGYTDHRYGDTDFAAYVAFYREVLAKVLARTPEFADDQECRRIVARIVARTVLMNRARMTPGKLLVLVRELLVKGLGLSYLHALALVIRAVCVSKFLNLRNGL